MARMQNKHRTKKKSKKMQKRKHHYNKKVSNNTDDGGQAMGEESRYVRMNKWGIDTWEKWRKLLTSKSITFSYRKHLNKLCLQALELIKYRL